MSLAFDDFRHRLERDAPAILAAIRANNAKLQACHRHQFDAPPGAHRIGAKYTCRHCGGTVDAHAVHWYEQGLSHAK